MDIGQIILDISSAQQGNRAELATLVDEPLLNQESIEKMKHAEGKDMAFNEVLDILSNAVRK